MGLIKIRILLFVIILTKTDGYSLFRIHRKENIINQN